MLVARGQLDGFAAADEYVLASFLSFELLVKLETYNNDK